MTDYEKEKILMVCESFGGGVFTYVSQLCNDMVDDFEFILHIHLDRKLLRTTKTF